MDTFTVGGDEVAFTGAFAEAAIGAGLGVDADEEADDCVVAGAVSVTGRERDAFARVVFAADLVCARFFGSDAVFLRT